MVALMPSAGMGAVRGLAGGKVKMVWSFQVRPCRGLEQCMWGAGRR
jgi:hypothetical protein